MMSNVGDATLAPLQINGSASIMLDCFSQQSMMLDEVHLWKQLKPISRILSYIMDASAQYTGQ